MVSKADLHVHSRYSDRPTQWVLRRVGAPECYTKPIDVYETARRRGMQFVTISDHNRIEGALEIAHLPGAFVSNEVTAYFPDDGCKVHVLCWDITEPQFEEIQRLRENIVELRDYFCESGIVHACAHPLYSVNDRLTLHHFERLLLLFNVFEAMNGSRNRRGNDLVRSIIAGLSCEDFERMAERHGVAPVGATPWVKGEVGGSDDHSGAFIAKGYTECPAAKTPRAFLRHITDRRSRAGGLDGTPLSFAHSLYSIGYQYYRDRLLSKGSDGRDLVVQVMGEVFGPQQTQVGLKDRVVYLAGRFAGQPEKVAEVEFKRLVTTEMSKLVGGEWLGDDFVASEERHEDINRRTFMLASRISNELLFQFTRKFIQKLTTGSIFGSLEALSAVGPVLLGIAPYLFAFAHQNQDRAFLAEVGERFLNSPRAPEEKVGCVIDATLQTDVAGSVSTLDGILDAPASVRTYLHFGQADSAPLGRVQLFPEVGHLELPGYEGVSLQFPPLLDLVDYCDREQFTSIVVGSPGLPGLAAVAAARMLSIRLIGVYDNDLPALIGASTDDESMEDAAWSYVRWFYDQMDVTYVPDELVERKLAVKGFDRSKLRLFTGTRGLAQMAQDALFLERRA